MSIFAFASVIYEFHALLKYNLVLAETYGIGTGLPKYKCPKYFTDLPISLDVSLVKSFVFSINTDLYQG
jgi:hypothetical protein